MWNITGGACVVGFIGAKFFTVCAFAVACCCCGSAPVFGCVGRQIASKYGCGRHADGLPMARDEPRVLQIISVAAAVADKLPPAASNMPT